MRTVVNSVIASFRRLDKVVMHMITIPAIVVVTVLSTAFGPQPATARQMSAALAPSQETVNALSSDHIDQLNKRLDTMERANDERFNRTDRFVEIILGVMLTILATLLVNTIQNKNRRKY